MKTNVLISFFALMIVVLISACNPTEETMENKRQGIIPDDGALNPVSLEEVQKRLEIYAPFKLTVDISHLSEKEKQILPLLFEVAGIMNEIFWQQAIGYKENFLNRITDEPTKKFAKINYGPWDRLNNNKPFIDGIGKKPAGANFYPVDMTKEEFEAFDNPDKTSLYTLIRRNNDGSLKTVWYHDAYAGKLQKAAKLMKQAAELSDDPGFKKYMNLRADALLTDDYQPSDFAWMDMRTSKIDFVVGPIENYEDALFGYKAANESFILLKDIEWSKKLEKFSSLLPGLQAGLPVDDKYKKDVPGSKADMNAYDVIYYAGDCNAGSKTIAINLPNNEEVHLKIGSRKL